MRLRVLAAVLSLGALMLSSSAQAADPPIFDFNGYATGVSDVISSTLTMRSILTNNGVIPTPIPMDFMNNQFTLVISNATLASIMGVARNYTGATIAIYEDPISGGTAANYASPSTFTDGTAILTGVFNGTLVRNRFTATLGNFVGAVNFTGGTRLAEISNRTNGWPCAGGWSRTISGIPAGYDENWDGKLDLAPVGIEEKTWQGVKQLYR